MKTSSYIRSLDYNPVTRKLTVVFQDGAKIVYDGVHPRTASAVMNAESIGEKFTELVRDRHSHRTLKAAA